MASHSSALRFHLCEMTFLVFLLYSLNRVHFFFVKKNVQTVTPVHILLYCKYTLHEPLFYTHKHSSVVVCCLCYCHLTWLKTKVATFTSLPCSLLYIILIIITTFLEHSSSYMLPATTHSSFVIISSNTSCVVAKAQRREHQERNSNFRSS